MSDTIQRMTRVLSFPRKRESIKKMCIWIPAFAGMTTIALASSPKPFLTGTGNTVSFRSFEDDSGGFYVAWTDQQAGQVVGLCAQHVDLKGQSQWGDAGLCITARLSLATDWSGLADGRGGLTLFWNERDGVHAKRFRPNDAQGKPGNSILMSSSTAIQPDAVPDAAGGTLVVWREKRSTGGYMIMAQRLDTEGRPVWVRGGIRVSLRASNQTNPRVIYDNMSGMIVAWRDEVNNASELRVQRIDFQGNRLWTLEGLKITAPVGVSEFPNMAPLGTGAVVLAWSGPSRQTTQIFLQKVGPEPKLKWEDMMLASDLPILFNRWNPVLVGDEEGGTWIAWEDFRDQTNYQIRLNHLHGDSVSPWPAGEIAVAPAAGDQGKMTMMGDGKGGVWLAWIDNRLSTIGLYVQQIDKEGSRLQGPKGRLISDRLHKPTLPQLVTLGAGKAAVSWADRPKKGEWALYWTML